MKYALLSQHGYARTIPDRPYAKIARIMKLTAFLFFVVFMQVSAGVYSQTVKLNENNSGLERIFNEIRKQTGYNFLYNNRLLKKTVPVNIKVNGEELKSVLDRVFENQPLSYSIIDKTIVVKKKKTTAEQVETPAIRQESIPEPTFGKNDLGAPNLLANKVAAYQLPVVEVTGKVTDDKGEPLPGVSIVIKGLSQGTTSASDGKFSLAVPGTSFGPDLFFCGICLQRSGCGNAKRYQCDPCGGYQSTGRSSGSRLW